MKIKSEFSNAPLLWYNNITKPGTMSEYIVHEIVETEDITSEL